MFGFYLNFGRWSPKSCLHLRLITQGATKNNVTQILEITVLIFLLPNTGISTGPNYSVSVGV